MTKNPFAAGFSGEAPTATKPVTPPSERQVLIREPGFYPDILPAQYFAEPCEHPALTNSLIKLLSPEGAAPAKAAHAHPAIGMPAEDLKETKAQYMGALVHRLALDKGDDYEISPYATYQSNDAKAWKADVEKRGIVPVKQAEYDEAKKIADVLRLEIVNASAGFSYQTEVVMAWHEDVQLAHGQMVKIWCRSMIDVWVPDLNLALDIKTCVDASDDALQKWFYNAYATQECWYLRGLQKLTSKPKDVRMGFVFAEKTAPYLARTAFSTDAFRTGAWMNCEKAMKTFAECLTAGEWPGYAPYEALPTMWQVSRWAEMEESEITADG